MICKNRPSFIFAVITGIGKGKLVCEPGLAKNIDGTAFDIYIHFSQTSRERETLTDKIVRLIRNEPDDVTE